MQGAVKSRMKSGDIETHFLSDNKYNKILQGFAAIETPGSAKQGGLKIRSRQLVVSDVPNFPNRHELGK